MTPILVNGRYAAKRMTGVQRYAAEIVRRLGTRCRLVGTAVPDGVRGHRWEQASLPLRCRGSLLWSPCNTGPLAVRRQVVTIHDATYADTPECFSRPFAAWYRFLLPRLARRVARVMTVSQFSRRRLAELTGLAEADIDVIPNGVDPRFAPPSAEAVAAVRQRFDLPGPYVLSLGSIEPRKNLATLLRAWPRVAARRPDLTLAIAGGGNAIYGHVGVDGIQHVRPLGYVPDDLLPALYGGAEAFVFPSVYEGFGLPPLEAMACGAAVVCSDATALPEVVGDAAVMVSPTDADAMSAGDRAGDGRRRVAGRAGRAGPGARDPVRLGHVGRVGLAIAVPRGKYELTVAGDEMVGRALPAAVGGGGQCPPYTSACPGGSSVRTAIVHEWLTNYAGSERVVEQLLRVYPRSDLYALVDFLPDDARGFLGGRRATTSFVQRLPLARKHFRQYLPLMPMAVEQFDLSGHDVIVSSNHAVAKGVIVGPDQLHVSYVHSPIRYAWDLQHQYLAESGLDRGVKGIATRAVLHYLRQWDAAAASRVGRFVANSRYVARRILNCYRRSAEVIYPPVDVDAFPLRTDKDDFYLAASRMVPYKRMPLIARAFAAMPDRRLVVVGDGTELAKVHAAAGPNVQVLGYQSNDVLRDLMQRARAFVFAAEEDFGITPVEAMACGTPVIAFGRGGATETVRDGVTGTFFAEQTVASLVEAVGRFERMAFDPAAIRRHAEFFRPERFRAEFAALIDREWAAFQDLQRGDEPAPYGTTASMSAISGR